MKLKIRPSLYVLSAAILASCTTVPTTENKYMPAQTFENLQPMALNVRDKEVKGTPFRNGADITFPYDLTEMTEIYFKRKLNPNGSHGKIVATIEEAIVEDVFDKGDSKALGWLGVGGFDVYNMRLKIRLEHISDSGDILYGNVVNAQRQLKISQHASVAQREGDQFEALEKMFIEIDRLVDGVLVDKMRLKSYAY